MTAHDRIRDIDQYGWNDGYRAGQIERAQLVAEKADLEAANTELRNENRALKARIRRLTKDAAT